MCLSISSIFITLLITSILIFVFDLLLKHKRSYSFFRVDFLGILAFIIYFRLLFPVEFKFTHTIVATKIMNPVYSFMYLKISNNHLYDLLLLLWIIGIAIFTIFYILSLIQLNQKIHILRLHSKKKRHSNIDVYISKYIQTPTVFTLKKAIFLPDVSYSESELDHILAHEINHIKYHDGLVKQLLNILVVFYWWNPLVYVFRKQLHLLLEMRADYNSTKNLENIEKNQYIQDLIQIQKKAYTTQPSNPSLSSHMIDENIQILKYRINYLTEDTYNKKTNTFFLVLLIFLPFFTNSIVLEAAFPSPIEDQVLSEEDIENGYITLENNGDYVFHLGKFEGIIENPNSKEFRNLPLLTNGKEP